MLPNGKNQEALVRLSRITPEDNYDHEKYANDKHCLAESSIPALAISVR
jgi:hypothetical protein